MNTCEYVCDQANWWVLAGDKVSFKKLSITQKRGSQPFWCV